MEDIVFPLTTCCHFKRDTLTLGAVKLEDFTLDFSFSLTVGLTNELVLPSLKLDFYVWSRTPDAHSQESVIFLPELRSECGTSISSLLADE